ncbi:MAG: MBL fold metallo-hydrolase [Clostridium sp.]|uniref:MBL fold metallo-hydrolase n=1 Tax=Clostridium sp. TaxID=1506 RepID=UPI003EE63E50
MFISWLGNSSFLIKTSLGKRILIDPINKFHSCSLENITPNIITLSSENFKCSCLSEFSPATKTLSNISSFESDIGTIYSIPSFSDNLNGLKRGMNKIFIYIIDGLKLCHLGYLGHIPDSSTINEIKNCDILFLPIGGNITLNGKIAYKLSKLICPRIIIPMNYKFNPYSFLFSSPQDFLMLNKNIVNIKDNSFLINLDTIHTFKEGTTLLLSPTKINSII